MLMSICIVFPVTYYCVDTCIHLAVIYDWYLLSSAVLRTDMLMFFCNILCNICMTLCITTMSICVVNYVIMDWYLFLHS